MKAPLSVMHITYDMRIGGTEMVIKNLIEGFDRADFAMSIFCIETPLGPWGEMLAADGIPIIAYARQPGFDRSLIKAIRRHIRQHNVDIIHCHQYTPWIYGVLAAVGLKTRVIFTEHGRFYPDFGTWKRKLINPVLANMTNAETAISEATKQALVIHENLNAKDIDVIYNGIRPLKVDSNQSELKTSLSIDENKIILGTIARFDPIKNHLMMLRAFKDCLDNGLNAVLVMVGDGEMRPAIESLINELAIGDDVILTGYQPQPAQYLALMDIFLLSSFSEGTSMTLLEAMSLGKPCVVTDAGGNKEVIKHEYNGLVVPNDDQAAFGSAITRIANDGQCYEAFSVNGKQRFTQYFSVDSMCQAFGQLYNKVCQRGQR